jgi:hypothetical protein
MDDEADINNLSKLMSNSDIKAVIKIHPIKKTSGLDGFIAEFYQTIKQELTSILLKLFQKIERKGTLQTRSIKSVLPQYQNWKRI